MSAAAVETASYVYGVIASEDRASVPPELEVELIDAGPLVAVTRRVGLDEFGEDVLPQNLNDRAWLEDKARAHEDVLTAVASSAAVVPLRFGAIFRTTGDVRELLEERRDVLLAGLERVRGRIEIGVKVWADEGRLGAAPARSGSEGSSGRDYLEARRTAQRQAADVQALCADVARSTYERLAALAVDAVANRPQPRELTGRDDVMFLNAAFLVESDDAAIVAEAARIATEVAELGFIVEVTGPWPAHNFVEAAEAAR